VPVVAAHPQHSRTIGQTIGGTPVSEFDRPKLEIVRQSFDEAMIVVFEKPASAGVILTGHGGQAMNWATSRLRINNAGWSGWLSFSFRVWAFEFRRRCLRPASPRKQPSS